VGRLSLLLMVFVCMSLMDCIEGFSLTVLRASYRKVTSCLFRTIGRHGQFSANHFDQGIFNSDKARDKLRVRSWEAVQSRFSYLTYFSSCTLLHANILEDARELYFDNIWRRHFSHFGRSLGKRRRV